MKINHSKSENNQTIILSIEEFGKLIKEENLQLEKSKLKEYNYSNDDTNDSLNEYISISNQRNRREIEEKKIFFENPLQKITIKGNNTKNSIFQNFNKVKNRQIKKKLEKVENPFQFKMKNELGLTFNEKIVANFLYDD